MSSDRVTLVDYGADVGEPTGDAHLGPDLNVDDTTETEDAPLIDDRLSSRLTTWGLDGLADRHETIREIADAGGAEYDAVFDDLESIGRLDEFVGDAGRKWRISRTELERRAAARVMSTEKPEERECRECGKRVTQTPNCGEVGHKKGQRPEDDQCSQLIGGGE